MVPLLVVCDGIHRFIPKPVHEFVALSREDLGFVDCDKTLSGDRLDIGGLMAADIAAVGVIVYRGRDVNIDVCCGDEGDFRVLMDQSI